MGIPGNRGQRKGEKSTLAKKKLLALCVLEQNDPTPERTLKLQLFLFVLFFSIHSCEYGEHANNFVQLIGAFCPQKKLGIS